MLSAGCRPAGGKYNSSLIVHRHYLAEDRLSENTFKLCRSHICYSSGCLIPSERSPQCDGPSNGDFIVLHDLYIQQPIGNSSRFRNWIRPLLSYLALISLCQFIENRLPVSMDSDQILSPSRSAPLPTKRVWTSPPRRAPVAANRLRALIMDALMESKRDMMERSAESSSWKAMRVLEENLALIPKIDSLLSDILYSTPVVQCGNGSSVSHLIDKLLMTTNSIVLIW